MDFVNNFKLLYVKDMLKMWLNDDEPPKIFKGNYEKKNVGLVLTHNYKPVFFINYDYRDDDDMNDEYNIAYIRIEWIVLQSQKPYQLKVFWNYYF